MNEDNEIRLPPSEPPSQEPSGTEGCLVTVFKLLAILIIGTFLIAGLIFATCFLPLRR